MALGVACLCWFVGFLLLVDGVTFCCYDNALSVAFVSLNRLQRFSALRRLNTFNAPFWYLFVAFCLFKS